MNDSAPHSRRDTHVCPHQGAFMLDNWIRKIIQNPDRILGKYIRKGDTVLDIGCGPGFFATEMAKMVGKTGKVFAVDLQEEMLNKVRKKAAAKNVAAVMAYHRCSGNRIGIQLHDPADFILAYYVVHELPDAARFFEEVKHLLKQSGRCLVVEPRMHVGKSQFQKMIRTAKKLGLSVIERPNHKGGRSVLLALGR